MRRVRHFLQLLVRVAALGSVVATSPVAHAQAVKTGFAVNRYEPTAAGEWSFWVDHPWFSSTRYFAAGVTLNYGHNPLVFGTLGRDGSFNRTVSVIEHQFLGHVDLAGSFLDRVLITASLPITLLELGTPAGGAAPSSSVAVGDPRVGAWVRLFGQPYRSAVSLSIGLNAWIPLRSFGELSGVSTTSSDQGLRFLPKLALGGLTKHIMWSFTAGFYYREPARIGAGVSDSGSSIGSELQLGASISYADLDRRFAIGPEALLGTVLLGTDAVKPFSREFTSLEVLLAGHYNIARLINIGAAVGIGALRTPGTPDVRALLRLAYAPIRGPEDSDKDGIPDKQDACPKEAGIRTDDERTHGCPDRDRDGIVDASDLCPDVHKSANPDPTRLGCPAADRDGDGVFDHEDLCPDTAKGPKPDPAKLGCPAGDRDGDGVVDPEDQCPDLAQGAKPDPAKLGCPIQDRDGDGVADAQDQCPDTHQGSKPDPAKLGCPLPDRDKDSVVDNEDACPDQPGAPDPDPKKNGCPGSVNITGGQLKIIQPVFFATGKDVILKKSFPILASVAKTLKAATDIKKVEIGGHTDDRGKPELNRDLSERRAKSVMRYLTETGGIEASRLSAKGYGPDKPIADNKSRKGREKNRRVEFVITDPAQSQSVQQAKDVSVPDSEDQSDRSSGTSKKDKKAQKSKKDAQDKQDSPDQTDKKDTKSSRSKRSKKDKDSDAKDSDAKDSSSDKVDKKSKSKKSKSKATDSAG
ncbi:MAG: OmpA family protein [Myxococcales bacterium]|nr:OmpA family protein [Myxococcales bacterium]